MTVDTSRMFESPPRCFTPPPPPAGDDEMSGNGTRCGRRVISSFAQCSPPPTPRIRKSMLSSDVKTSLRSNLEMLSTPDLLDASKAASSSRRSLPARFDYSFERSQQMFYRGLDESRMRRQSAAALEQLLQQAVAVAAEYNDGSSSSLPTAGEDYDYSERDLDDDDVVVRESMTLTDLTTPVPRQSATVSQQMLAGFDESPTGIMDFFMCPPLLSGDVGSSKGKDISNPAGGEQRAPHGLQSLESL